MPSLRSALSSDDPFQVGAQFELPPVSLVKKEAEIPPPEKVSFEGVDWSVVSNKLQEARGQALAGDVGRCFSAQCSLHEAFNGLFGSSQGNWLVPAIQSICKNTHRLAVAGGKENSAITLLQASFSLCMNHRVEFSAGADFSREGSKKAGVLYIVNHLFALYFSVNNLRLCKNLVRPVESRKLHVVGNKSDLVTYRFFVGRLHMFEDQYDLAESNLDYALLHCHKSHQSNKRAILRYLIPVKLYRGRLATPQLLQKYNLMEFLPLVEGARLGDLKTFSDGLTKYQDLFIRRGVYLLLEKCKTLCYRNLFKRVHLIMGTPHLNLKDVANALKWLGLSMDMDEIECVLAGLIYRKLVRGYISHAKRVLVLSKTNPFPASEVIKK